VQEVAEVARVSRTLGIFLRSATFSKLSSEAVVRYAKYAVCIWKKTAKAESYTFETDYTHSFDVKIDYTYLTEGTAAGRRKGYQKRLTHINGTLLRNPTKEPY